MEYPKTLEELLLICLICVAIVLCIFLIVAIGRLSKTIKKVDKTVDDVSAITKVAKERTLQADKLVTEALDSVDRFVESVKKGEGVFSVFKKASELIQKVKALLGIGKKDEAIEEDYISDKEK